MSSPHHSLHFNTPKLPGYYSPLVINSITNSPEFVTLILTDCQITSLGEIREAVFPHTCDRTTPFFLLDVPYDTYPQVLSPDRSSARTVHQLPWRSIHRRDIIDLSCIAHDPRFYYQPFANIIYCTIQSSNPLHLRETSPDQATHLIARSQWHAPYRDSLSYEQKSGHCEPIYLTNIRQAFGAILYRHALSAISRYGVDYWVIPLTKPKSPA